VSSGGASSGGASSGGASSGGAGGRASGGKDASADAPSEGAASDAALVCSNTDGGRDAGEHWHDFSANQCKACPAATTLTCQDLLASPGPSFDPATHVLTLHVSPGRTEIRTARYSFNFKILLADGGGVLAGNSSVAGSVDRDTVTIDLSKALLGAGRHLGDYPASEMTLDAGALNVKDACGTSIYTLNSTEGIRITLADGGTPLVVCHKIP
jgi:hypothetical protein